MGKTGAHPLTFGGLAKRLFWGITVQLSVMLCSLPVQAATYGYAQTPLNWIDNTAHTDVTWGGSAQCAAWNSAPVDDDGTAPITIGSITPSNSGMARLQATCAPSPCGSASHCSRSL